MSEDVQKLCRICAHDSGRYRKASVVHIFSPEGLKKNIADKINCHLPINVSKSDGLPQIVCQPCVDKLDICHSLVNVCLEAKEKIQHLINNTAKMAWKPKGKFEKIRNSIAKEESYDQEPKLSKKQEHSAKQHAKPIVEEEDSDVWPDDNVDPVIEESDDEWRPEGGDVNMSDVEESTATTTRTSKGINFPTAEVSVVAVAVTPGSDGKVLDATTQLYFVSVDKSEHANAKERTKAAKLAVGLISDDAAIKFTTPQGCSVCKKDRVDLPSLSESSDKSSEKCPHYSQTVDNMVIFKQLSNLTEVSTKMFKENPSKNVVTYIGNYNVEHKNFIFANQPTENCCSQVEVERKSMLSESILATFKHAEIKVKYLCGVCDKFYPYNKDTFIGHIMENHFGIPDAYKNLAHACTICSKQLKSKNALQRHMSIKHKSLEDAGSHAKEEEVVCDECGKMVLKRLVSTHKKGHVRRECQYCHQILAYRTWNRHRRFHENPSAAIDKKVSCIEKPSPVFIKARQFSCNYCHNVLERTPWAYHYAYKTVFGAEVGCPEKIPDPLQEKLDHDQQMKFNDVMKSAFKVWSKKRKLVKGYGYHYEGNRRKAVYHSTKPVQKKPKMECPDCHMMLTEYSFNVHKLRHAGKLDVECSYCQKKFVDKLMLSRHVKHVHLKIGPTCQYCNKYIAKKSKLLAHEALHRGERNFKCPHCPKYFPGMPNVYNHVKLVHERVVYVRKGRQKKAAPPSALEEPPIQNNVLVQPIPQIPDPQEFPIYFPM